jgi:hypothetical protein
MCSSELESSFALPSKLQRLGLSRNYLMVLRIEKYSDVEYEDIIHDIVFDRHPKYPSAHP